MAEGNAQLVRTTIDLFNRGKIEEALDSTHEEFELDWSNSIGPLKGVYTGRDRALELWRSFLEAWDEVSWDPQEILELDDGHVVVVNHVRMRGKGSGVDVDATGVQLWTISDGKPSRIKLYQTKSEALDSLAG